MLPERGAIDDARWRGGLDQRQQQIGEQEARQIIDGEAQLVTVGALLSLRSVVLRPDAGIADKDVDLLVIGLDRLGEPARARKRSEIGLIELRRRVALALDL